MHPAAAQNAAPHANNLVAGTRAGEVIAVAVVVAVIVSAKSVLCTQPFAPVAEKKLPYPSSPEQTARYIARTATSLATTVTRVLIADRAGSPHVPDYRQS